MLEARRMQINVSETLERRLRMIVRAEQEKRWLEQNRAAIDAYNQRVATHGLLADDAALLFDPERQVDVTTAVRRLLEDHALAERLTKRGRERVKEFTWQRTGSATLAGYRQAITTRLNDESSRPGH